MPYGLTSKQYYCLCVIQELTDKHGVSPIYDEIAHELEIRSKSGIARLVKGLEERGYLTRIPARARSLMILRRVPMPVEAEIVLAEACDDAAIAALRPKPEKAHDQ